ncbi:MAG TPA: acylneuraminate cytidylyltransferase family protein [Bryobacteraceae bacterium]|jgi:N-acylneuraminate cytidylyltransferase|nr:acylneuraminate cytidylyltransferase family protein [Bryobacteraceae bacterium]
MVYSIIPARGGSKGIPGKNISDLAGYPLIAYSIKASLRASSIDRTIVSTDSEEIARIAMAFGAEVPFMRPAAIAGDKSTDYEFFCHALEWFRVNEGREPELLVHLRPTTPLREPRQIDDAVEFFCRHPEATALRSVHEMSESAYKTFEMQDGILKASFSGSFELDSSNVERQRFPPTYAANGYVDVLRSSFIAQNGRIHGNRVLAFVTPAVVEVDTHAELEILAALTQRDPNLRDQLFK